MLFSSSFDCCCHSLTRSIQIYHFKMSFHKHIEIDDMYRAWFSCCCDGYWVYKLECEHVCVCAEKLSHCMRIFTSLSSVLSFGPSISLEIEYNSQKRKKKKTIKWKRKKTENMSILLIFMYWYSLFVEKYVTEEKNHKIDDRKTEKKILKLKLVEFFGHQTDLNM